MRARVNEKFVPKLERKSGIVLGLTLSHDRSACLLVDGRVHVAIAEERLTRLKHDIPLNARRERFCHVPLEAIEYCLATISCTLSDVDLIVASTSYVLDTKTGERRALRVEDIVDQCAGVSPQHVRVLTHHFAHAVSASWCTNFDEAAVLVVDGGGSIVGYDAGGRPAAFERSTLYEMKERKLKLIQR